MITIYAGSEVTGGIPQVDLMKEPISLIRHDRDISYNREVVVKALGAIAKEKVPVTRGYTYNHYCPYQRIFNALQDYCFGRTRYDVAIWLFGEHPGVWDAAKNPCVLTKLGIQPTEDIELVFEASGDPLHCVLAYDIYMEWAFYSICDWPQNMFYGTGQTDGAGTKLDVPITPGFDAVQLARVTAAFQKLLEVIPTLSNAVQVSNQQYAKIYTAAGQKALGDVAHMSAQAIQATLKKTLAIEGAQNGLQGSDAKKRKYLEDSERFTPLQITDGTFGQ